MKIRTIISTVLLATLVLSCNKESMPEIDFHELGFENSGTAYAGDELHMDAEVLAENKIDKIQVILHHEGEHGHKSAGILLEEEWEFDSTYTEYSGQKNAHFHKHIDIPAEAETGDYHFDFIVSDMEGYQSSFESDVEILAPAAK